jgi:hypothetical protein
VVVSELLFETMNLPELPSPGDITETTAPLPAPEETIRALAYQLWELEGRPDGKADEHWHRAVAQLDPDLPHDEPQPKVV